MCLQHDAQGEFRGPHNYFVIIVDDFPSFKGAWVSVWELEQCEDIFGDMDVVADDLPKLADGIIGASRN